MDEESFIFFSEFLNAMTAMTAESQVAAECEVSNENLVPVAQGDDDARVEPVYAVLQNLPVQIDDQAQAENQNAAQIDEVENPPIKDLNVTPNENEVESPRRSILKVPKKVGRPKSFGLKGRESKAKKKLRFDDEDLDLARKNFSRNDESDGSLGIWVQCVECTKWRHLKYARSFKSIGENWKCSRNQHSNLKSCAAAQEGSVVEIDEKSILNRFACGTVVWAKVGTCPWWPGMIDYDPDENKFVRVDENKTRAAYHVTFWENQNKVSRKWVPVNNIWPYALIDGWTKNKNVKRAYEKRIEEATNRAEEALAMGVKMRLENFAFKNVYKANGPNRPRRGSAGSNENPRKKLKCDSDKADAIPKPAEGKLPDLVQEVSRKEEAEKVIANFATLDSPKESKNDSDESFNIEEEVKKAIANFPSPDSQNENQNDVEANCNNEDVSPKLVNPKLVPKFKSKAKHSSNATSTKNSKQEE